MAGYGIKSFLIAQSLNQIEKAYGANNSVLDNCHVRVAFATNDERTAKRVSDALGTATELRDSTNYAGHRLSPWLGHLMVSRQETARPLLTPGEVMQLPPADELLLVSGIHPIRARKARYYEDPRLSERILPPPILGKHIGKGTDMTADDWRALPHLTAAAPRQTSGGQPIDADPANAGIRREPELPEHEEIVPEQRVPDREFDVLEDESDLDAAKARTLRQSVRIVARQAAMDPADGIGL
jgi:type IV secretion system protein VirD4